MTNKLFIITPSPKGVLSQMFENVPSLQGACYVLSPNIEMAIKKAHKHFTKAGHKRVVIIAAKQLDGELLL